MISFLNSNIMKMMKIDFSGINTGPGLVFVVYPQGLLKMPVPHFWTVLFFFMLLCVALNHEVQEE